MPYEPFIYSVGNGYLPISDEDETTALERPQWLSGTQPVVNPTSDQLTGFAKFAAGVGAGIAVGQHRFASGKRGWDYLIQGVRAAEEYSPGRILRTFQVSHMLSPLEAASRGVRVLDSTLLYKMAHGNPAERAWLQHLSRVVGKQVTRSEILSQGIRFKGGKLLLDQSGEVLLEHAGVIRAPTGAGTRLQEGYVRSLAKGPVPYVEQAMTHRITYLDKLGMEQSEAFMFTGGGSRLQSTSRWLKGYGTALVERLNQLAKSPAELPIISDIFERVPIIKHLGLSVKSSSGLRTLAKLTGKLGLLGGATYTAYQQLDYMVRKSEVAEGTVFDEGITAGLATLWTRGQVATAKAMDWLGLHKYREEQERIAPGSTSFSKLLAFPIMGVFGGLGIGYGERLWRQVAYQRRLGITAGEASQAVDAETAFFRESVYGREFPERLKTNLSSESLEMARTRAREKLVGWEGKLARGLAGVQKKGGLLGRAARVFGEIHPGRTRWMIGAAVGAALIAPFIPGALIPEERPEELEKLYSGEKKVAIRKGRWWEFGRTPFEGTTIDRYRVHWYPRMLARAKEKSIYGEEEEISPFKRWYLENFTYELERKHYRDRPYPISGAAFEDVPFIGSILAATIGRLVKPPALMHTDEWLRKGPSGEEEYAAPPPRFGETFLPGELNRGAPITPYGAKGVIGDVLYKAQEAVGLPGFTMASIKGAITGQTDTFAQETMLESARKMYGAEREYWEQDLGGGLGTCFVEGSIVQTNKGPKSIELIKVGDMVLSQGGYRRVKNIFVKKPSSKILDIQARSLGINIECTANHWIPIIRRHYFSNGHMKPWQEQNLDRLEVQASDILPGDYLILQTDPLEKELVIDLATTGKSYTDKYVYLQASNSFAFGYELLEQKKVISRKELRELGIPDSISKEVIRQFRKDITPKRINRFLSVDRELAWIIGWYIAEGSVDDTKLIFTMHANEQKYAIRILDVFKNLGFNGSISIKDNVLRLRIYSSQLARYFRIFGIHAEDKHIPFDYQQLPKNILVRLVDGLMLGDGWTYGFTSASSQLVKDLAYCYIRLGVIPYVNLNYHEKSSGYMPQGTPRKDSVRSYLSLKKGRFRYLIEGDTVFVKVSDIREIFYEKKIEKVYDLEIEDIHFYTVDRILVHNTELIRRLYPHRRRQIEEYNPIRNTMPEWLPGPGDRSPDFLHGDPFVKVTEGEMRLPGVGYAALHPELQGVKPEDYPAFHRYSIIADVAPYSEKYKDALIGVRAAISRKELTEQQIAEFKTIQQQVVERKKRKTFTPYKYRERVRTPIEALLTRANEAEKAPKEKPSWFERTVGTYWEEMAHGAETPLEMLTPVSPASKLIHMRTAVEDYEKTQVYGTDNSFWDHPIRDFFGPFFEGARHSFGSDRIPDEVRERRDLEQYFDLLKYVKHTRLKTTAAISGDAAMYRESEEKRRETLFGINPFTWNFSHIMRALPRRERDYFNEFAEADMAERAKIVNMIPENEQALMMARWKLKDADDMKKAIKKGLLSEEQVDRAKGVLEQLYQEKETEGFPKTQELWAEYLTSRLPNETYPDWYRRTKLLEKELKGKQLPGPDWVGWHPSVDLEDIKLKIVQDEGKNMYDYDLWPDRARAVARRPVVAEAAAEVTQAVEAKEDPAAIRARITSVLAANKVQPLQVTLLPSSTGETVVNLEVVDDRSKSSREEIRRRAS